MELSEFQKTYHWMHGLREYFNAQGEGEKYEVMRTGIVNVKLLQS